MPLILDYQNKRKEEVHGVVSHNSSFRAGSLICTIIIYSQKNSIGFLLGFLQEQTAIFAIK
jgi:hypothetical protein